MRRSVPVTLVIGLLLVAPMAGAALAQDGGQFVRGEPDLDVYAPEPTLTPGTTAQLTLQIENDGEIRAGATSQRAVVTTARAVSVELDERRTPIVVETQRTSIGSVADGGVREVPITVTVPEDAAPGEYELDVRLRYSHTSQYAPQSGAVQERSRTVTRSVDVRIDDGPRFEIETVTSDVRIGDSGTLRTVVRNVGDEPARELTVGLESESADVTLGGHSRNAGRIERLAPGENATITYDVSVTSGVSGRAFPLVGRVQFTDTDGVRSVQAGIPIELRPASAQVFSIAVDESTLRVGETGAVRGTIRNEGPANLTDVVLAIENAPFDPRTPTYAVGDLDRGDSTTFRFRGTVPAEADAVPQQIDVLTRYRTPADGEGVADDSLRVPVADRRDSVAITAVDSQFEAGSAGVLELEVTNQRDVEIRDVRLNVAVEAPLDSEFRSTILPSLQPGETDRIAFDLEVDSDAPVSRYPATVIVEYTDPDDELVTARPAVVAITVTEAEGVELLSIELVIFGALLLLVGAVFVWLYRR
ncbi:MAG: COG1361 S-layer family protein [Halobacteriota archaeon]|uniref:COG1361 S-layer family protein n=1 Tax=Natronomonas sp. TaxID=2184060 RepID=UPI003975967B